MEVKFLNQPKEVKLGDILKARLKEDFSEVYFIAGMLKDTGIEDIYDDLVQSMEKPKELTICMGIDRKNTSKDMLLKILDAGCKLKVHINTDGSKVESRAFIFESENGTSYIYITGSKFSSGGLFENICLVTEIKYNFEEKKAFDLAKNNILQGVLTEFHDIDRDEVILLAEKGEIVARITERKIPNIAEMYGAASTASGEKSLGEQVYDESTSSGNSFNFADFADIEIDLEPGIVMKKNLELATENEAKKEKKEKEELLKSLKKTESDLDKLYGKKAEKEETKKTTIHKSDKLDYDKMTTLIIESNKIVEKGVGEGEFKIPKSIADNLDKYFSNDMVKFNIMDNKENIEKSDDAVSIFRTDKGISIKSQVLIDLKLEEGDIVRIIKENDNEYRCEVIRKDSEEHNIWICYCINSIRGQKRKFGII